MDLCPPTGITDIPYRGPMCLTPLGDDASVVRREKEVTDARHGEDPEVPALHGRHASHIAARSRCPVQAVRRRLSQAPNQALTQEGDNTMMRLRKIMYSLGALALLAMSVGAGFKPGS